MLSHTSASASESHPTPGGHSTSAHTGPETSGHPAPHHPSTPGQPSAPATRTATTHTATKLPASGHTTPTGHGNPTQPVHVTPAYTAPAHVTPPVTGQPSVAAHSPAPARPQARERRPAEPVWPTRPGHVWGAYPPTWPPRLVTPAHPVTHPPVAPIWPLPPVWHLPIGVTGHPPVTWPWGPGRIDHGPVILSRPTRTASPDLASAAPHQTRARSYRVAMAILRRPVRSTHSRASRSRTV